MKQPKLILCLAVLAVIGTGAVLFQFRSHRAPESTAEFSAAAVATAEPASHASLPVAARNQGPSRPALQQRGLRHPEFSVESVTSETVRADRVLATVNGRAIQLKDLIPLGPDETEKAMTAEQYESRLNRAIEMELTFQAAQVRSVGLTAEQQGRLNKIAPDHQAQFHEYKQQGLSWTSVTTVQLEFEQRLISALMLQQNLVTKETAVAPSPNPIIQSRYEQALHDMLARLKASANVSRSGATL